jgi:hypothetical protein
MHCQVTFLVLKVRDEPLHEQHLVAVSNVKVTRLDQGCDSRSVAVLAVFLVVYQGTTGCQAVDRTNAGLSAVGKILSSNGLGVGALCPSMQCAT